jgi:ribosomal protein L37AE/L43A
MARDDEMECSPASMEESVRKTYAKTRRMHIIFKSLCFVVFVMGVFLAEWQGDIFWVGLGFIGAVACAVLLMLNWKCPRCRSSFHRYSGGANVFCGGCGVRVSGEPFLCPECGDMVNQQGFGMKYCPKCGVRLR